MNFFWGGEELWKRIKGEIPAPPKNLIKKKSFGFASFGLASGQAG
jgi:hypothetical protein